MRLLTAASDEGDVSESEQWIDRDGERRPAMEVGGRSKASGGRSVRSRMSCCWVFLDLVVVFLQWTHVVDPSPTILPKGHRPDQLSDRVGFGSGQKKSDIFFFGLYPARPNHRAEFLDSRPTCHMVGLGSGKIWSNPIFCVQNSGRVGSGFESKNSAQV